MDVWPSSTPPSNHKRKHTLTPHQFEDFLREVFEASIPSSYKPADYHAPVAVGKIVSFR